MTTKPTTEFYLVWSAGPNKGQRACDDVWTDPQQAAEKMCYNNRYFKEQNMEQRVRMERHTLTDEETANRLWRAREQARFADGTYRPVVWNTAMSWPTALQSLVELHHVHVAVANPANVAFTESEEHGRQDRQISMKPGRYLTRFFSSQLSSDTIQQLAAMHDAEFGVLSLQFAATADDIETVYRYGPSSCMSAPPSEYRSPEHPVRVYAAGDLQVAYLGSLDTEDEDGNEIDPHIVARCLVWPARKIYGRIYGASARLESLLKAEGYCYSFGFQGARLLKIVADSGEYVCPYLDGGLAVTVGKDFLYIAESGIPAGSTNGVLPCGSSCEACGEYVLDTWTVIVTSRGETEEWCESCRDSETSCCEHCGDIMRDDIGVTVQPSEALYCPRCAARYTNCCDDCSEHFTDGLNDDNLCPACAPDESDSDSDSETPAVATA